MLRNEKNPVVHQEHVYDDADVALTMALPWMHELGWPFTAVRLLLVQATNSQPLFRTKEKVTHLALQQIQSVRRVGSAG